MKQTPEIPAFFLLEVQNFIMKTFIRLIIPILISICMGFNELTAFAESTGDPNIDSGGGGMGSGTSQNF